MEYYYIGQIVLFGFQFVPNGFRACDGSLMSIAQNQALFSLLGTTYGGDGITTFALPDLRGRIPLNQGQGPGLSNYTIGEASGSETVTLTSAQLPAHTHLLLASAQEGNTNDPTGAVPAAYGSSLPPAGPYTSGQATGFMSSAAVSSAGGNQPVDRRPPYLVMNWCIATEGIYPSRG
jgi:microcystin-dependent protein